VLLNHERKTVWQWVHGDRSLLPAPCFCPDCKSPLSAVRGNNAVWHWRHKASQRDPSCRMGGETAWHLNMKQHFTTQGFTPEVSQDIKGKNFRFDVAWGADTVPPKHMIVEFVSSLSDGYLNKAAHLFSEDLSETVAWVFSAKAFVAKRHHRCSKNGLVGLLKPAAYDYVSGLMQTGQAIYVDHGDGYVHWKNNVWYPIRDAEWAELVRAGRPTEAHQERLENLKWNLKTPVERAKLAMLKRRFGM
jgi:uncharacterized protein YbaR (Trm112 family)